MNKLLLPVLTIFCLMMEACEAATPPEHLSDPIFAFNGSVQGSINIFPHELLKQVFKKEAKSKYFSNINMWVFADVAMQDGGRYLIVDGDHPISRGNLWDGKVEQLGGLVLLVKNEEVKVVSDSSSVFKDTYVQEQGSLNHLADTAVAELAKDYVAKLVSFLGGRESAKAKFSDLCDELLKNWISSTALESELVKNELISQQRMERIKAIHDTRGCSKH